MRKDDKIWHNSINFEFFFYFKFGTLKIYTKYTYLFDCHFILLVVFGLGFFFQVNNLNYLMKLFIKYSQGYDRIIHKKKPISIPFPACLPAFVLGYSIVLVAFEN